MTKQRNRHAMSFTKRELEALSGLLYALNAAGDPRVVLNDEVVNAMTTIQRATKRALGIPTAYKRRLPTHCRKGHKYTPENTTLRILDDDREHRLCIACRDVNELKSRRKRDLKRAAEKQMAAQSEERRAS